MALEALFDAVIVKPIEIEETTYGNIIVPDVGKEKNETGEVIAVGPGKPTIIRWDYLFLTQLKIGDKVSSTNQWVLLNSPMMEKNIM